MNLEKHNFVHFDGFIQVEPYTDHEEKGRCKIYDENGLYLDYIPVQDFDLDMFESGDEADYNEYIGYINDIIKSPTPHTVFSDICDSYDFGDTLEQVMYNTIDSLYQFDDERIAEIEADLLVLSEVDFCNKYDINKIGGEYFKGDWT